MNNDEEEMIRPKDITEEEVDYDDNHDVPSITDFREISDNVNELIADETSTKPEIEGDINNKEDTDGTEDDQPVPNQVISNNNDTVAGSCGKSVIFPHLVGFHSSRQYIY